MDILTILLFMLFLIGAGLFVNTQLFVRRSERAYPPVGKFLTVDGVRLHYVMQGTGKPVVLLHGNAGFIQDYTMTILDRLAQEYRVVAFDRPGHGYSQRPPNANPQTQARLVHDALQQLGVEKPVLVGHSWSGALIMAYALEYPNEISGIVSLAGAVYGAKYSGSPLDRVITAPIIGTLMRHLIVPLIGRNFVLQTLLYAYSPDPVPQNYFAAAAALWLRPRHAYAISADNINMGPALLELSQRYNEIRAPLIIVQGEDDLDVGAPYHAIPLHRHINHSKLILIPKTGHELPHTRPDIVIDAIRQACGDAPTASAFKETLAHVA